MQTTTLTRRAALAGTASACLVAALPTPNDRTFAEERFLRAWDRLTPAQKQWALRELEIMFPIA